MINYYKGKQIYLLVDSETKKVITLVNEPIECFMRVIAPAPFYDKIADWISQENAIIKDYTALIFVVAVSMGYFEVFYSWCRVHLKSVYGNFIREIFARLAVMILLFFVYFKWMDEKQFIYTVAIVYVARMLIMMFYAFKVYKPESFKLIWPENFKEIL